MSGGTILVYLMRRDLRTSDNPILYRLSATEHGFTHLLPVYILPPDQIEVSGLVKDGKMSPYPPARYDLSQRWKCGHLRAKFIAESLWDLKGNLESLGSGLCIRVGTFDGVLNGIIQHYAANREGPQVTAVWMAEDYSPGQQREEDTISAICETHGIEFDRLYDVKYFMHDLQLPENKTGIDSLPDTFDLFWQGLGTMAQKPFDPFPLLERYFLPPFPDRASLPPQEAPFEIPDTLEELVQRLQSPVQLPMPHLDGPEFRDASMPQTLVGGETRGRQRCRYIIKKGIVSSHHLLSDDVHVGDGHHGLQSYLSLGCITARQVHQELLKLERGTDPSMAQTLGFGRGCSAGTESIRYYLLVLNFIRLSIIKHGSELHSLEGAGTGKNPSKTWKSSVIQDLERPGQAVENVVSMTQFMMGLTGFGLIDAIMRQLYVTGEMTLRGEEIAIGFFALYAGLDWRYGAEYVSSLSTDHDPALHFYLSQNCSGVGPSYETRGSRISPAKISQHVDPDCTFILKWMPELRGLPRRRNVFRVITTAPSLLQRYGLASSIMVAHEVPCARDVGSITEITNAHGAPMETHMENTVALAQRENGPIHTADISTETGFRFGFEDQALVEAPLGSELVQGPPPPPRSRGPSLPFRSDHGPAKASVASTPRASTLPAEATVRGGSMAFPWTNPLGQHPVTMLHPPARFPHLLPSQAPFHHLHIPVSQLSSQSYDTAALPLRPQSLPPPPPPPLLHPLPAPVDAYFPPYEQRTLSGSSSPAQLLPSLPAAPSPPPPPPPTLSAAIPHLSSTPLVPLPQDDIPIPSIEEHMPPIITIPLRRNPRRFRPRIAILPHPALAGFLPVVAEPEVIRYYIGQLRQPRFRASSNYTFIHLPFLDNNRIHIIHCPRGVVPLRGDPDFDTFRESRPAAPEDVDLEALDELIDEVDDDEVAVHGPWIGYCRRPPQPSRFNSRYR